MGFRYRKSINLGFGFRINLSQSGIGYSWGANGYRLTKTATGKIRETISLPGSGVAYIKEYGSNKMPKSEKVLNQKNTFKEESPLFDSCYGEDVEDCFIASKNLGEFFKTLECVLFSPINSFFLSSSQEEIDLSKVSIKDESVIELLSPIISTIVNNQNNSIDSILDCLTEVQTSGIFKRQVGKDEKRSYLVVQGDNVIIRFKFNGCPCSYSFSGKIGFLKELKTERNKAIEYIEYKIKTEGLCINSFYTYKDILGVCNITPDGVFFTSAQCGGVNLSLQAINLRFASLLE